MSGLNSYEPGIPDLKVNRFLSHHLPTQGQAADRDNAEPCDTDSDSISPSQNKYTVRSATGGLQGLKVDQAGMVWASNGTLLGRVHDGSQFDSEELEDYSINEKREAFDQYGQKIGQALAHETSPATPSSNVREHPFYTVMPDKNGQYYCPYTASEGCRYRPQKSKSKFEWVMFRGLL